MCQHNYLCEGLVRYNLLHIITKRWTYMYGDWCLLCFVLFLFLKSNVGAVTENTLEFRLDGTKINEENNTWQRYIVIKQEKKGGLVALVELQTLVSYFNKCTPGY